MIKLQRILYPTDLSTEADEALRYALALTKAYEAKLILLYCKQPGSVNDWINGSRAPDLFRQSLFTRLDANELRAFDWSGVVCESDNVGLTIAKEAQTRKADLIVMRSRRRPHAAGLLGSTAETVCRKAPCPVLVTHPNELEFVGLSTQEIDLRRVLVAHDFSANAILAFKYGSSIAQQYQTELHLLHVLDGAGSFEPELAWASSIASPHLLAATRLKHAIPKEAALWCHIIESVRSGKAHEEVLRYARENQIDLICIGASGSGWSMGKLFGSTVDRVLRQAPCPVLVTRPIRHVEPN